MVSLGAGARGRRKGDPRGGGRGARGEPRGSSGAAGGLGVPEGRVHALQPLGRGSARAGAGAPRGSVWAALRFLDSSRTARRPRLPSLPGLPRPATAPHAGALQRLPRAHAHAHARAWVQPWEPPSPQTFQGSQGTLQRADTQGVLRGWGAEGRACLGPRQRPPSLFGGHDLPAPRAPARSCPRPPAGTEGAGAETLRSCSWSACSVLSLPGSKGRRLLPAQSPHLLQGFSLPGS